MVGTRGQLRASSISLRIVHYGLCYATLMGIVWFSCKVNPSDGRLVARNRKWYKRFCLLTRFILCCVFFVTQFLSLSEMEDYHLSIILYIHLTGSVLFIYVILMMQLRYGKQLIRLMNTFLKLHHQIRTSICYQYSRFGSKRELIMLILKVYCLLHEVAYLIPEAIIDFSISDSLVRLGQMYILVSLGLISHICFLGYLTIGIFYDQINNYVRHKLRRQLQDLNNQRGVQVNRRQLKAAESRLDECLAIYTEIQRVTSFFQKLFDLPLCNILLFNYICMALVIYYILIKKYSGFQLWLLLVRVFLNIFLILLSVHGAMSSSRVVRRLSLENYYVTEEKSWHVKLEVFLNRLNYYEFRVRPLGLFDVTNQLVLVFLSGLITFLTYEIGYRMRLNL